MIRRVRRYELARKLIVSPNTISSWRSRYSDFPQPIGRFYDLDAVLKWKREHDRKESASGKSIPRASA